MRVSLRNKLLAAVAAGLALTALGMAPAQAEDTSTTFTLTDAGLGITVPGSATLSVSTNMGVTSLSSQLGGITVNDLRGALTASWTATVSATDFITGAGGANRTIPKGNVSYDSGPATASSGAGVDVPTTGAVTLDQARTAFAHTGVVGTQSTSWNPTISVTVPATVIAGTYTGTITHSIA